MYSVRSNLVYYVVIALIVCTSIVAAAVPGFIVNSNDAIRAAQDAGYKSPVITAEHRVLASLSGCDTSDAAGFEVDAVNPAGDHVKLLVCVGATIRFH